MYQKKPFFNIGYNWVYFDCSYLFLFLNIGFALSILPFSLLSILLLFFVGNKNFNDALLIEKLKIYPKKIILERKEPNNDIKKWHSNPYWTKVNIYNNGPVESYLTLKGMKRSRIRLFSYSRRTN